MNKVINAIFIFFAISIIFLPAFLWLSGNSPKAIDIIENRNLKQIPIFSQLPYSEWSKEFEEYFSENLPLRSQAISLFMYIWEYKLYTPNRYALRSTKSGTVFYKDFVMLGTTPYPQEKLYKLGALFVGRQTFFSKYNIPYALMIAPDKETTRYMELPEWAIEPRLNFIYPQLVELLKDANVNILPILEAMQQFPPYELANEKFDIAHWSSLGAFQAHKVLSKELLKEIPTLENFDLEKVLEFDVYNQNVGPYGDEKVKYLKFNKYDCFQNDNKIKFDLNLQVNRTQLHVTNLCSDTGYLFMSGDSFFMSGARTSIGIIPPNAAQVKSFSFIDNADFTYSNMKKIVNSLLKPNIVAEGHGERDVHGLYARNYQPEVNLLGEKFLGTLQFALEPKTFSMIDIVNVNNATLIIDEEQVSVKTNNAENTTLVIKKAIKSNSEGYAVITAKVKSEQGGMIVLEYRHKDVDEQYKRLTLPIMANDPFVYFQILDEPNVLFEAQIVLQKNQEYQFQFMDFLNEIEGDI